MSEIGLLPDQLSNCVWTTDQAGNQKTAFQTYKRFGCFAHIFNTVLKHALKEDFLLREAHEMDACIAAVKAAIKYLKKSGQAARLDNALHPFFAPRFNSLYRTFKSAYDQREQVVELLLKSGNSRLQLF